MSKKVETDVKTEVVVPPALDRCPVCGMDVVASVPETGERWCYARHHWRRDSYGKGVLLDDDGNDLLDPGLEQFVK